MLQLNLMKKSIILLMACMERNFTVKIHAMVSLITQQLIGRVMYSHVVQCRAQKKQQLVIYTKNVLRVFGKAKNILNIVKAFLKVSVNIKIAAVEHSEGQLNIINILRMKASIAMRYLQNPKINRMKKNTPTYIILKKSFFTHFPRQGFITRILKILFFLTEKLTFQRFLS